MIYYDAELILKMAPNKNNEISGSISKLLVVEVLVTTKICFKLFLLLIYLFIYHDFYLIMHS